jgi:YfiH family protein
MEPFVEKKRESEHNPVLLWLEEWINLDPKLSVGFSTRLGGISQGDCNSLNCAFHVNDNPQDVIENRKIMAKLIGFPFDAWTSAEQVHGSDVYRVTSKDKGKGSLSRESAIQNKDALITNETGIWLASFYADCVPLYFFDPINKVIGVAHAGWKGTVSAIAASTIQSMVDEFGCRVENLRAAMGPSIGPCCYEVDETVAYHFKKAEMTYGLTGKDNGRYWLDLKEINRQIMIKAGIMPTHIEISTLCTACRPQQFFSHRKEMGKTGRMMSWIGMKKG